MAATARGEGPSGFSLEAILIESWMPYSRSSSSIGLPGWYGVRVRIHSGTSLLMSMASPGAVVGGRVRAEDSDGLAEGPDLAQRPGDGLVAEVALHVDEKQVLPGPALERTGLDAQEADGVVGERLEGAVERADLVAHRD